MKKRVSILLLILVMLMSTMSVYADLDTNLQQDVKATEAKDMKIKVDGKLVSAVDDTGKVFNPVIIDGRSYLPLRALGNLVGVTVGYNTDTRRILVDTKTAKEQKVGAEQPKGTNISKAAKIVKDMYIELNGVDFFPKNSDGSIAYPALIDGRSYLPIRATEPVFGIKVDYDTPSRTIIIKTKNYVEVSNDGYTVETESNDVLRTANVIPFNGGKMKGTLAEVGNGSNEEINRTDFFKITVPENGILELKFTGDGRDTYRVEAFDKSEGYLWSTDLPVENTITRTYASEKGDIYLRLSGYNGTTTYKIDTKFTPYKQDVEDNDTVEKLQPYTLGTQVKGLFGSFQNNTSGDTDIYDYYEIKDTNKTSFEINVTSNGPVSVVVYDLVTGNYIGQVETTKNVFSGTLTNEYPDDNKGGYYFYVTGSAGDDAAPNIYTVTVK